VTLGLDHAVRTLYLSMKKRFIASESLRLALLRLRAGGTRQSEIGRRSGFIFPTTFSQIVHGSYPVRLDDPRVLRLCKIVGVPPEDAFVPIVTDDERESLPA
jgi:hypothetical protein